MHQCTAPAPELDHLRSAALELATASSMVSNSVLTGSDPAIEACFAQFRAAKARFSGALADYKDSL